MQWQKSMVMLDTNMILRYLLDDNPEMASKAEEYINTKDVYISVSKNLV